MNPSILIARKEAGELLLSARGLLWLLVMSGVLSGFALLLVGDTELSLLDNAQVVYDMAAIITALGALLALLVGVDAVAGERERGSLIPLLLAPVSRPMILFGKLGGVAIAWLVTYGLALPYLWAVGSTGQNLTQAAALLALVGTPVVLGYGFLGLALGSWLRAIRFGLLIGMGLLLLSGSPILLGPGLRQSAIGRTFDAINPFSAAVNGYDAVIIDSASVVSQWPGLLTALIWLALTLWLAVAGFRRVTA
jgi:ABC-type transport system involved in multi-copper enzyme maturation permease subunit